jgi:hypothetical protein
MIGRGVPQDFVAAHMWLNLAASLEKNGDMQKAFAQQRDDLAKMMTSAQIAEAQRLAREWKPITKPEFRSWTSFSVSLTCFYGRF